MAPRVASLSGRRCDLPLLLSPNALTMALCLTVQPITERFNVTFIIPAMISIHPFSVYDALVQRLATLCLDGLFGFHAFQGVQGGADDIVVVA